MPANHGCHRGRTASSIKPSAYFATWRFLSANEKGNRIDRSNKRSKCQGHLATHLSSITRQEVCRENHRRGYVARTELARRHNDAKLVLLFLAFRVVERRRNGTAQFAEKSPFKRRRPNDVRRQGEQTSSMELIPDRPEKDRRNCRDHLKKSKARGQPSIHFRSL
jgi:hypothetical protein